MVGKNVTVIGGKAFFGCTKLNRITIKSSKLKKIGAGAFKKTGAKAVVKVPSKQLKAYKKLLKGKGLSRVSGCVLLYNTAAYSCVVSLFIIQHYLSVFRASKLVFLPYN